MAKWPCALRKFDDLSTEVVENKFADQKLFSFHTLEQVSDLAHHLLVHLQVSPLHSRCHGPLLVAVWELEDHLV